MPPSKEEVKVTTDALRVEAQEYEGLSTHMGQVKATVDDLTLTEGAFFIGDMVTSKVAKSGYDGLHSMMSRLIGEASAEFHELGGALRKVADMYEQTDGEIATDLSKIYGK